MIKGKRDDVVLAIETSKQRETGNRQDSDQPGASSDRHKLCQAAHKAHVLHLSMHGVVQCMQHAARAEEEEGFEEGVREEVEHTGARAICTACYAEADEHVAKLADGREGQHALEVGLGEGAGGRKDGGNAANPGNDLKRRWSRSGKKREGT